MTTTVSATEHRFETAVTAVIVANSIVMLLALIDDSHRELLENVDLVCLWAFAAELAVRLWKAKLGFFHSPWSCLDAAIIVVALLPAAGGGIAVARLGRLARSGHLLKHVAHLRLWRLAGVGAILRHARGLTAAAVAASVLLAALIVAPAAHADQVIEGCTWNEAANAWQYPDDSLCRGTGEDPTVDSAGNPACANHNPAIPEVRFGALTYSCIGGLP